MLTAMADEFGGADPGRPVRADRRRGDRPRHRRHARRPPLARRADAQPRRLHHRRDRPRRDQGGGHVRGRRTHRAPRTDASAPLSRWPKRRSTRSMTATRTSTASAEPARRRPARAIGLLGHHAGALRRHAAGHHRAPGRLRRDVGAALERRAPTSRSPRPPATARTSSAACASSRRRASTACSSSCSPTARACASRARCAETRLPICLANIQPVPDGHGRVGHG